MKIGVFEGISFELRELIAVIGMKFIFPSHNFIIIIGFNIFKFFPKGLIINPQLSLLFPFFKAKFASNFIIFANNNR